MTRRLYRSRTDSMLSGVAAGLATYLNADPALVRIAWAILVPLTGGVALIAYIVASFVVPEEPAPIRADATAPDSAAATAVDEPAPAGPDGRAGIVVGIGLVVIGVWFLVRPTLPDINWDLVWPLVIVAIGGLILVRSMSRGDR
ncbi:hypothetical protein BH23CHL9_BH23CHL9_01760 [soil metagenome]|jgi:phage shock protein PspC (stress-responsive transcriptional regulator)